MNGFLAEGKVYFNHGNLINVFFLTGRYLNLYYIFSANNLVSIHSQLKYLDTYRQIQLVFIFYKNIQHCGTLISAFGNFIKNANFLLILTKHVKRALSNYQFYNQRYYQTQSFRSLEAWDRISIKVRNVSPIIYLHGHFNVILIL